MSSASEHPLLLLAGENVSSQHRVESDYSVNSYSDVQEWERILRRELHADI